MTWSELPSDVARNVLEPLHTAAVDEQLKIAPAATEPEGHEPLVVSVPFTNTPTEPAAMAAEPVERIVTEVPA